MDVLYEEPEDVPFVGQAKVSSASVQQEEEADHKHADRVSVWHDVFLNLVIVAAFNKLGNFFEAGYLNTLPWYYPYVSFLAVFLPMWLHWYNTTLYNNRFDNTTDGIHQFFNFVNTMLVVGASLNLSTCSTYAYLSDTGNEATTYDCSGFAYFMVLLKCLLVLMFARVSIIQKPARSFALVRVCMHSVVAVIWLLVATVGALNTYIFAMLWWAAIFVDIFWTPMMSLLRKYWSPTPVPAKVEHLEERLGLFVMLSLGEMIAMVAFSSLEEDKYEVYLNAAFVTGIAFLLKAMYHDVGLTYAREGAHAVKRHVLSAFCWIWLQIPLLFSIFVTSVTLRYAVIGKLQEYTTCRWALLISLSLILLSLSGMQACHIKPKRASITRIQLPIRMLVRLICSGVFIFLGLLPNDWIPDSLLLLFIVMTLCTTSLVDTFGRQRTHPKEALAEDTNLLS